MPVYDCGAPECEECQRAFGPDRSKAIADYEARAKAYAPLEQNPKITGQPMRFTDGTPVFARGFGGLAI